ncbi:MAG: acyl-CoA thioesterase [Prevotellaceae bacterium]|jgi:acyl-CoA thioester hydrolase|nr:acyl-CoA thioesterase [Prevotellaceae bacterium]
MSSNNNNNVLLTASKEVEVRFSEVDSMSIVWHGAYALYFEDAREAFGAKYTLGYLDIFDKGYYAPLVDLKFCYKKPLRYGTKARIDITYHSTAAAKIVFDYEIFDVDNGLLVVTGSSTQVFLDKQYQLVWATPPFYEAWKQKWGAL